MATQPSLRSDALAHGEGEDVSRPALHVVPDTDGESESPPGLVPAAASLAESSWLDPQTAHALAETWAHLAAVQRTMARTRYGPLDAFDASSRASGRCDWWLMEAERLRLAHQAPRPDRVLPDPADNTAQITADPSIPGDLPDPGQALTPAPAPGSVQPQLRWNLPPRAPAANSPLLQPVTLPDGTVESPEEWLSRVFADPEVYDLDPDVLEGQALAAEAEFVISVNKRSLSARAGRWSANHPWRAIGLWVSLIGLVVAASLMTGLTLLTDAQITSGESHRAHEMLEAADFAQPAEENVLLQGPRGLKVDAPAFKKVRREVLEVLRRHPKLAHDIMAPYQPGGEVLISQDRTAAMLHFEVAGSPSTAYKRIEPLVTDLKKVEDRHPGFKIDEFGDATAKRATLRATDHITKLSELLTVPITLTILLLALGTVVAAGLPVALAIFSVAGGTAAVALLSVVQPSSYLTASVVMLVGMAVGTDYAFFYLRRVREERSYGRPLREAIDVASATSGRSVVISGVTVIIAMCGLYLSGSADFRSIGSGTIFVTTFAVLGAVLVLPAMMSLIGDRVERWRLPFVKTRDDVRRGRADLLTRVLASVLRRPVLAMTASLALLTLLTLPMVDLKILQPGFVDVNPKDAREVVTFERMLKAFPGSGTPAHVVVKARDVRAPAVQRELKDLRKRAVATRQMFEPITISVSPDHTVARVTIPLKGDGTSTPSQDALDTLRNMLIPETVGTVADEVAVTGRTADDRDFVRLTNDRIPLVMGFVVLLTFVILLCSFRSLVVPIKAIVCNLAAVGAAYGVLVMVFQRGWGADLINARTNGTVVSWLPLFMFVVLFGLSMDYHVFILSRVRELWGRGLDADRAVVIGIAGTTRTVTSAALVMAGVFAVLIVMPTLDMQQLGLGMTVAILVDAFVVRVVLLPATMKLLGDANWYLPRWLEWLPDLGGHSHTWSEDDAMPELEVPLAMALDMGRLSKVA